MGINGGLSVWMLDVEDVAVAKGRQFDAVYIAIFDREDGLAVDAADLHVNARVEVVRSDLGKVSRQEIGLPRLDGKQIVALGLKPKGNREQDDKEKAT